MPMFANVALALVLAAAEPSGFDAVMKEAKQALARSDLDSARTLCRDAVSESGDGLEGALRRARAQGLCGEVELKAKHFDDAARAFHDAAISANDDVRLRRKMLDLRARAATEGKMPRQL